MFAKVALFVAAALAASVAASPIDNSCNSGPVMCCGSLNAHDSKAATGILSEVSVAVSAVTAMVGAECNPITGIGAGTGANWCVFFLLCC